MTMTDELLCQMECQLHGIVRRVAATAEILNLCRYMSESSRVLSAWGEVLESQGTELQEIARLLKVNK